MQFDSGDIEFLCNITSLSYGGLISLLEEDFDLLIDSISKAGIEQAQISLPLYTKLTIFKEAKGFILADKSYVADCISDHYPKLYKRSHYLIDQQLSVEEQGQYYLVLAGLFPGFINEKKRRNGGPDIDFYISIAKKSFENIDRFSLAERIYDWVHLLNNLKSKQWK